MKSTFLFLSTLIASFAFSQDYNSGVAIMHDIPVKMESQIMVTDSLITISMSGQDYFYQVVEKPAPGIYDAEFGVLNSRFTINHQPKPMKLKGFKYTHTIHVASSNPEMAPPMTFLCQMQQ